MGLYAFRSVELPCTNRISQYRMKIPPLCRSEIHQHTGSRSDRTRGEAKRGRLKIYMGYAAGVGKTYQMLEEAQVLEAKGIDVVIGYFEPHGRRENRGPRDGPTEVDPIPRLPFRRD